MKVKKFYALLGVLLICTFGLCACAPKYEDIKNKYKDDGYKVTEIPTGSATAKDISTMYDFDLEKVDGMFYALKDSGDVPNANRVDVVSFSDSKEATALYNKQKENDTPNFDVVKKGNTVIYGTSDAVKLLK